MVPSIGLAHSSSLCKNKPYCVALVWNLSLQQIAACGQTMTPNFNGEQSKADKNG